MMQYQKMLMNTRRMLFAKGMCLVGKGGHVVCFTSVTTPAAMVEPTYLSMNRPSSL